MAKNTKPAKSQFAAKLSPLAGAILVALSQGAWAQLPQGGQFQAGSGSIGYAGNAVNVSVTAAPGAAGANVGVVNWQSFNVGAGNSANFANNIPGSSSLNLVNIDRQGAASQIHGAIKGSGPGMNIILVNPNGVTVGDGAQISTTGAFMAVAGDLAPSSAKDGAAGAVTIALNNAPVVFSSKAQASGAGMIKAGPAEALRLVAAGPEASAPSVVGSSDLRLEGNAQWKMEGGAMVGASQRVVADGAMKISGSLIAGHSAIDLSAASVAIEASRIEAKNAGARIRIGGGFEGKDADLPNAQSVSVDKGSAIVAGKGSEVVVWSDGKTSFEGLIEAPLAKAEVSGKEELLYSGVANLKDAETGAFGDLLLDPATINIAPQGLDPISGTATTITISGATLGANLDTANVTLTTTTGDINVRDDVTGGGGSLTLRAGRHVNFGTQFDYTQPSSAPADRADIVLNGGNLTVTATQDITMFATSIDTGGGSFSATATRNAYLSPWAAYGPTAAYFGNIGELSSADIYANIATQGGALSVRGAAARIDGATLDAGAGAVTITGTTWANVGSFLFDRFDLDGATPGDWVSENTKIRGLAGVAVVSPSIFITGLEVLGGDLALQGGSVALQYQTSDLWVLADGWGALNPSESSILLNGGDLRVTGTTLTMKGITVDTGGGDFLANMTSRADNRFSGSSTSPTADLQFIGEGGDTAGRVLARGGNISILARTVELAPLSTGYNKDGYDLSTTGDGSIEVRSRGGNFLFGKSAASAERGDIVMSSTGTFTTGTGIVSNGANTIATRSAAGDPGNISLSAATSMSLGGRIISEALPGAAKAGDISLTAGTTMAIGNAGIWASGYDSDMSLLGSGAISLVSGGAMTINDSQISNVGERALGGAVPDSVGAPITIRGTVLTMSQKTSTLTATDVAYWADGVGTTLSSPPAGLTVDQADRYWMVHGSGDVSLQATAGPGTSSVGRIYSHGDLGISVVGTLSGTGLRADGLLNTTQANSASGGLTSLTGIRSAGGSIQGQGSVSASTVTNDGGDLFVSSSASSATVGSYFADADGYVSADGFTNARIWGQGGSFDLIARNGWGDVMFSNGVGGGDAVSRGAMTATLSGSEGAYLFESQTAGVSFYGDDNIGSAVALRALAGDAIVTGGWTRVGDLTMDAVNATIETGAKFRADGNVAVSASNNAALTDLSILGDLTVAAGGSAVVTGLSSLWDYGWMTLDQAGMRRDGVYNSVGGDASISGAAGVSLKDFIVAGSLDASSANGNIQAIAGAVGLGVWAGESKNHLNLYTYGEADSTGNASFSALNGTFFYGDGTLGGSLDVNGDLSIRARDYDGAAGYENAWRSQTNGQGGNLLIEATQDANHVNSYAERSLAIRAGGTATLEYPYVGYGWVEYDPSVSMTVDANEIVVIPGGWAESEGSLAFTSQNSILIGQAGDPATATNVRGWSSVRLTVDEKNTNTGNYDAASVLANHGTVLTGATYDTGLAQPAVEDSLSNIHLQLAAPTPAASWTIDPVVQSPLDPENDPNVAHPGYTWDAWAVPAAKTFAVPTANNVLGNLGSLEGASVKAYGSAAYYNALVGRTNYNLPGDLVAPDAYIPGVWVLAATIGIDILAADYSMLYGDAVPSLSWSCGAVDCATLSFSGSLSTLGSSSSNVGIYSIDQGSLSLASAGYHIESFAAGTLTISPRPLDVLALAAWKTYGQSDPALAYALSGLVNGDSAASVLSGSLSRAAGENAGIYAIGQGSLASSTNYAIQFTGANFTIDPASLLVVANAANKTYGQADPALGYSVSGLANGDVESGVLSGALSRQAGENVGAYAIEQGTLAANGNYVVGFVGEALRIDPATLLVNANAASKTYGQADPALTYTSVGLVGSDIIGGSLFRDSGENAGTYSIGQGSLDAGSNYTMAFTGADFTIDPAALSVIANPITKTYGQTDPALTYTASGLVGSDILSGSLFRDAGEIVGVYAIGQGSLDAGSNYTMTFTGANFTIDPAAAAPFDLSLANIAQNPITVETSAEEESPVLRTSVLVIPRDSGSGALFLDVAGPTIIIEPAPAPAKAPEAPAAETAKLDPIPAPVPVAIPEEPRKIVLRGVNFDNDKATLRPESYAILDQAAEILLQWGDVRVEVGGHTDWNHSDAYNMGLSKRRAEAVRRYLVGKGVQPERLTSAGYGESLPVADNREEKGRFLNRRVELIPQR